MKFPLTNWFVLVFVVLFMILGIDPVHAQDLDNTWKITMTNSKHPYTPQELPLKIGDTVKWINNDSVTHTVTSGLPDYLEYSGEFFQKTVKPGEEFSFTFVNDDFDSYYYFCEFHPWMTGRVFYNNYEGMDVDHFSITSDTQLYNTGEKIVFSGTYDDSYFNTDYTVLFFNETKDLIFTHYDTFTVKDDFFFEINLDHTWHPGKYLVKVIYGVPLKVGETFIEIKKNSIEFELRQQVPNLKTVAEFWCNGDIDSNTFVNQINQFSEHEIMPKQKNVKNSKIIPIWMKNNACWISNGFIDDDTFLNGLEYFLLEDIKNYKQAMYDQKKHTQQYTQTTTLQD